MPEIISFYRSVLQREEGAILCDSWFHNLYAAMTCGPASFAAMGRSSPPANEFPRPLAGSAVREPSERLNFTCPGVIGLPAAMDYLDAVGFFDR